MELAPAPDLFGSEFGAAYGVADTSSGKPCDSTGVGFGRMAVTPSPASGGTDPAVSTDTGAGVGSVCQNSVCVGAVDVAGLSDEGLRSRLGLVGRGESRLAAMKSHILAELGRRTNTADAQRIATDELLSSGREAKRDVETAVRLEALPDTSDALASGEIPQAHARLIARAAGEGPVDEAVLVKAARDENFDQFVKTVKRHQQDQSTDDGQTLLDRQRQRRRARIFESAETGMFVLTAQFDQITGARIATALTAKERELWHHEDAKNRRTPQQRMADALAELICDESGNNKKQGTNLLVLADFDVIKQQLVNARLADGTPIPAATLKDLALEADILPSIFDAKTQNMWLGRSRRTASEAQRMALIARDEHCVGCGANPLWCRAHHIAWWSKDGPTDFDNLLLVCDACHKKIHLQGWQVDQHPTTKKFYLKPPPEPDRCTPDNHPSDMNAKSPPPLPPTTAQSPTANLNPDTSSQPPEIGFGVRRNKSSETHSLDQKILAVPRVVHMARRFYR